MRTRALPILVAAAAAALSAAPPARAQIALAAGPPQAPAAGAPAPVLTLEEAIRTARERQPALRSARAGTEAARARSDLARSSLLPQLDASARYGRDTANVPGGPESWETAGSWLYGATLSQLVWDFGKSTGRFRAAREGAAAQEEAERATVLDVLLDVRSAFFSARAARDLVGVARETLENQEAHLRQVEAFVEVGTRPEIDLAQARTDRANAEVQLIVAENAYVVAKARLNQAMGVERSAEYRVSDDALPPLPGEDGPLEALVEEAVRARPDLAALAASRRSQQAVVDAARGGYLPTLGVQTSLVESGPALDETAWNWGASATLSWNLFGGGATRAEVREARAGLDALDAEADALRQAVRLEVDSARLALRATKSALGAAREALVNARERLRLAEGRYQAGAGSLLELSDAQVALTAAAAQQVRAEYELAAARAALLRALGREGS
jgi:outer membrane protein